jgi:hypothetical protein
MLRENVLFLREGEEEKCKRKRETGTGIRGREGRNVRDRQTDRQTEEREKVRRTDMLKENVMFVREGEEEKM